MLNKLLVATGNQGKLKEIREILSDIEVLGLSDAGIECDVEETGTTFAEISSRLISSLKVTLVEVPPVKSMP